MSLFDSASLVVTPNGVKAGKLYSIKPTDGSGDLSVTRATTATRVNSNGLIESVASNIPRLDYTNGSCPSILVEPQRTNLVLRSEEFDNASWTKINILSVSANSIISPDGNISADKIIPNTTNGGHYLVQNLTATNGVSYTYSIYAKKGEIDVLQLSPSSSYLTTSGFANFDLTNGVVSLTGGGVNANIINFGNGWFKCVATFTANASATGGYALFLQSSSNASRGASSTFNGTDALYLWGAQLEAGSNATSYIPTTSATVTRNADVISKTGISDLIGQTEGTLFFDFECGINDSIDYVFGINDGTTNNRIIIYRSSSNRIILQVRVNGGSQALIQTGIVTPNTRQKCAVAYKLNDIAFYVNGVQIGVDTSSTIPACSVLATNDGAGASLFYRPINQAILFKTRLTNTQLAQLTTL